LKLVGIGLAHLLACSCATCLFVYERNAIAANMADAYCVYMCKKKVDVLPNTSVLL